jgi:hypothetical protein
MERFLRLPRRHPASEDLWRANQCRKFHDPEVVLEILRDHGRGGFFGAVFDDPEGSTTPCGSKAFAIMENPAPS